ncbi:MAG TPA: hypothetical protein VG435_13540 [Acidimicrobiales bacterium]|nr:hypothetical protein [Acidimicrobiales bacterium]
MTDYDLEIDFMDMTDDRHVLTRLQDARHGLTPTVGRYVTVGSEDADPAVARVVKIDDDGIIELEVLPGPLETYRDLLTRA